MESVFMVVGGLMFFGGLGALFRKKWRGWKAFAAATIGFVLLISGGNMLDRQAKELGFASNAELESARKAGFDSAETYRAAMALQEQEKARLAEAAAVQAAAAKAEEEKKCRTDLKCWGEKSVLSATFACRPLIERMAKHDFQWTDSWSEPKFSHYRWKDKANGIVTHIGDKIKLQNGFGAWTHYVYECDFNPITERVLDIRAKPGRL
ncbi:hypothetical protein ACW7BJ_27995 [Azospirillum argentinense]